MKPSNDNAKSAVIGFVASVLLTLAAYAAVTMRLLPSSTLTLAILALAVVQLAVQLLFFLELGSETGSRWRLTTFLMTFGFVLIVVAGSIWIMAHLNYGMMASPDATMQYIQSQQGF